MFFNATAPERMELVLYLPGNRLWSVTVSPGVERFIGHYPRIDGFNAGPGLIEYRPVHAAN